MAKRPRSTEDYGPETRALGQVFYIRPGPEAAEEWDTLAKDSLYGNEPGQLFLVIARAWKRALRSLT